MKSLFFALVFSFVAAASAADSRPGPCTTWAKAVAKGTAVQRQNRLLDLHWQYTMDENPEWSTYVGEPGRDDRWSDMSFEGVERRKADMVCLQKLLKSLPVAGLKGEDLITRQLFQRKVDMAVESQAFPGELLAINQMWGAHQAIADTMLVMKKSTRAEVENMLKRLEGSPLMLEQSEALLREGLKRKITAVKMFMQAVPAQFDKLMPPKVEDSPIYQPFLDIATTVPEADREALRARAREVIGGKIYPALARMRGFLVKEYIPGARETTSFADMPGGPAWYAYKVKDHTTTDKTPDELHQLGLNEVARLLKEMEKVRAEVKFKGDQRAFNKFLFSDSRFFFKKESDLLTGFRDIAKRIDAQLPTLFRELPRLTYGVRPMPEFKAKESPAAYYEGGSMQAGRPGYFTANTYDLKSRPSWGMMALTLHEAVPGHHLQIARAQELPDLPKFRTEDGHTAFIEGWALYAEGLGYDMGLYDDPYSKYGQLGYEMWRAARLVVDTGLHSKNWSRQQAIDYMQSVVTQSVHESEVEVDRYISDPGQALAYKVGQLKIRELRERANGKLGERFDIRSFHDEVLRHGSLPMDVLDTVVDRWIGEQAKLASADVGTGTKK